MKIISESTEALIEKLLLSEQETDSIRAAIAKINKMGEREKFWEHNIVLKLHARLFRS